MYTALHACQAGLAFSGRNIMQIKYGLISCDSCPTAQRCVTSRMSKAKWGDAIPQLKETTDRAHMAVAMDHPVERWMINGQVVGNRGGELSDGDERSDAQILPAMLEVRVVSMTP